MTTEEAIQNLFNILDQHHRQGFKERDVKYELRHFLQAERERIEKSEQPSRHNKTTTDTNQRGEEMITKTKLVVFSILLVFGVAGTALAQTEKYCTKNDPCSLTWDANTEPDMNHYNVHLGSASGVYDSQNSPIEAPHPDATLGDVVEKFLIPDGKYYAAVTAVDHAGNESDFSNEITFTVDTTPPGAPTITIVIP